MIKPISLIFRTISPICAVTTFTKPEDHWSCKRSPDILTLVKHKTYKTWKIYDKEMTLTFNTHIPS